VVGVLAATGLVVAVDAPWLADRLQRPIPAVLVGVSAAAGLTSLGLLVWHRYLAVRITAGLAVAALLWAWAAAQHPYLLPPATTIADTAAHPAVLRAVLAAATAGAVILIPSLWWLLALFQTSPRSRAAPAEPLD
jgi:cytochrome d ubiquinol oxidase subunit II